MSIYSNDNISKIAKLTIRELPHLAKTTKIMAYIQYKVFDSIQTNILWSTMYAYIHVVQWA